MNVVRWLREALRGLAWRFRHRGEPPTEPISFRYLNEDQAAQLLEEAAQERLGMSAQQFREAWEEGKFSEDRASAAAEVAALLPLGR